jgi:hypothetical protein
VRQKGAPQIGRRRFFSWRLDKRSEPEIVPVGDAGLTGQGAYVITSTTHSAQHTATANPGRTLEILDRQRVGSIMRNWMRLEYPADPVGLLPGTVPVIGRSG